MSGHDSGRFLTRRAFVRSTVAGFAGGQTIAASTVATARPVDVTGQSRQRSVKLAVTPNPVAIDAPFTVQLTGLAPNQTVTMRGTLIDEAAQRWQSEGVYEADERGAVDLATEAPRDGTFAVPDPTALIWAALPPDGLQSDQVFAETVDPGPLTITAAIGEQQEVARVDLERRLFTPAIRRLPVTTDGLYGELYRPSGDDSVPAILLLGGSEGGLYYYVQREAALLATYGFAALALAYFGDVPGGQLPPLPANLPLEYFKTAIDWLQGQPGVQSERLGIMGHSLGGELALLLGATYPQLEAVVSYVGSGLVWPSFDLATPAWTLDGQPLPHLYDPLGWNQAVIPVERINGPLLVISGEDDRIWPSVILSQVAIDRLHRMNHPYPAEHLQYADAGHGIGAPYQPASQALDQFGGTVEGNAAAMTDSWPRVLRLFEERLRR